MCRQDAPAPVHYPGRTHVSLPALPADHSQEVRLCSVGDLAPGASRRFDVGAHRIALVRIGDDFYAIGDRCSHQNISLTEGEVLAEDCQVECYKHGSRFDLRTGAALSIPATKAVPTYDVRVEGDDVWVAIT